MTRFKSNASWSMLLRLEATDSHLAQLVLANSNGAAATKTAGTAVPRPELVVIVHSFLPKV
ncbi:MAG: hypothetical protein M1815_001838 [Lichina confinis]|nr:MAG: hypothetical protein M1815_001838 [Lichina confinis]